ncbi:MAG TPA: hypothetical protein VGK09_03885 [Rhodocyclaceae bacterium]|jgi:hypothetical protein
MNKLIQELGRLYFLPEQRGYSRQQIDSGNPVVNTASLITPAAISQNLDGTATVALKLVNPEGLVRALVITFDRAKDWNHLTTLYQGLEEDLKLPAPAVSISATGGFQLWLSLADNVTIAEATAFLEILRSKYLADIPVRHLKLSPSINEYSAGELPTVDLVPSFHQASGKWSAFIDPSMGGMFLDEPGLDMAPNMAGQADILAKFESIKSQDFQRVLASFQSPMPVELKLIETATNDQCGPTSHSRLDVGSNYTEPKSFLLAVMNSPSASPDQRIKAAQALLPYFERDVAK